MDAQQIVASDGHVLDVYRWEPVGSPRGLLQIVHGMAEHALRYDAFARQMADDGWLVVAHDQRGHGARAAADGRRGKFPDEGWERVVADVREVHDAMQAPALPWLLLGHSMGSFVARLAAARHGSQMAGLILIGTGGPLPTARVGVTIARARVAARGAHTPSPLLDKAVTAGFLRKIRDPRTPQDWLSRDPAVVDAYRADPLSGFVLSAGFYRELARMTVAANSRSTYERVPKDLPVLLLAGDGDPVGQYGDGVRTVADRLRRAGVRDVTATIYAGARHELLNEINRAAVISDIQRWRDSALVR